MKQLKLLSLFFAAFLASSCVPGTSDEVTDDVQLLSPKLSVTGLPGKEIIESASFNLTVSTKSDAEIKHTCTASESLVKVQVFGKIFRVTLGSPQQDTPVTITFSQDATEKYEAASADVSFTLKKDVQETPVAPPEEDPNLKGTRIVYQESTKDILNPERGLYKGAGDIRSASNPVSLSSVKAARADGKSIMYVGFYLTKFMDGDISQDYLDMIQTSMDAFREGGVKCILRFAYQNSESATPWDPPVDIVLRHVEQLKPILQKNEDVIFVLQAGFIGVWGEWYYTENFNSMSNRKLLADALLDALPKSRQIALRTPDFKMKMYGVALKDTITAATAHNESDLSRLAGHNDCFGASSSDMGTFDSNNHRNFWKAETRYTIMGGETCAVSDYCSCEVSSRDVEDYHWTYLNSGFNTSVLNGWKTAGCYNTIIKHLGYRLVLLDSYHTENPEAGKTFNLALRIVNRGYAAPQNPRNATLVFIDDKGNKTEFLLGSDPRTWHSGPITVKCEFTLPAAKGTLYLNLNDPLLPNRPEYSIAFANEGVFDESTGYNKILELGE